MVLIYDSKGKRVKTLPEEVNTAYYTRDKAEDMAERAKTELNKEKKHAGKYLWSEVRYVGVTHPADLIR